MEIGAETSANEGWVADRTPRPPAPAPEITDGFATERSLTHAGRPRRWPEPAGPNDEVAFVALLDDVGKAISVPNDR